ncbi:AsmA-like C-terminal region-containing protein, partial [Leptospira sp. SA-E8]|uniref:AsmA family protein n=1 Tax=Leptospira sp. SA-E8 TaxID=3422259 RepID=UPI003EC00FE2
MREIQVRESQGRKRRRIELAPLTASLYGGGVHGSLRINLDGDEPASPYPTYLAAKLDLRGVQVGPLLRDALNVRWLEGRGNVALDLRSGGGTLETLKRQLNGTVGLQLQDGALALDLAGTLRESLDQLRKKATPRSSPSPTPATTPAGDPSRWRTSFDQLRASFQIDEGVARNQDLSIQSPSLRVGGAGTAWIAEERLDYTLRVTVAPSVLQDGKSGSAADLDKLH